LRGQKFAPKGLVIPKSETYIAPGLKPESDGGYPVGAITGLKIMAKTNPGQFINQVKAEIGKVVWPTRQETTQTAIMVLIMTIILAVFFLGVDAFFNMIVQGLLGLAR
jgi:preprotein translocase subunit SecE